MPIPLQLTVRNEDHAKYLTQHIKSKLNKLEPFSQQIINCRIVVETTQNNQHQGNLHTVHIDILIPKDLIVINKIKNENVYIAIRDAIDAAYRRMQDERQRKNLYRQQR